MGYYKRGKPLTFEDCEALMATARNRADGKPMANNTRLYDARLDSFALRLHDTGVPHLDCFVLRLHDTDVLRIHPDGWEINSGGWRTVTTRQRLNDFGPVGITQRDWAWYVGTPTGDVPFVDWMFVDMSGKVWRNIARYRDSLKQLRHDESEVVE